MNKLTWRFTALDSWFFRESRPFDTIGGSELTTVFPPSPVTMAGAIRSAIGDFKGIDWHTFRLPDDKLKPEDVAQYTAFKTLIGTNAPSMNDPLGQLKIKGVFLSRKIPENDGWQRLYPVPAHLVATRENDKIKTLHFLQPGKPVDCDLGKQVCLAVAPFDIKGVKPLEGYWLTEAGFSKVLNGQLPDCEHELIPTSCLFKHEARLGIARNNQQRTSDKGMLYQTEHVRPLDSVAIEVDVEGLDATEYPRQQGIVRLGGEGRGAHFSVEPFANDRPGIDESKPELSAIKLILLSAVYAPQQDDYTPLPGFTKTEQDGKTVWRGHINNIDLTLHCAITGKVLREGGWDLQTRKSKPVRSLIPSGSVFYCTVNGDIKNALDNLQAAQLANNTLDCALGRGLLTATYWFKDENIQQEI